MPRPYRLHLAVRDDPGNRALYPRLAEIYADQGRLDRAAHCWAALAKKFPDDPLPYQRWGEILVDLGEHDKAREVWTRPPATNCRSIWKIPALKAGTPGSSWNPTASRCRSNCNTWKPCGKPPAA